MALAEVKTLYASNASQVAETLRKNADAIERGEYGQVRCAVMVIVGGNDVENIDVFGMGNTNFWDSLGVLQGGISKLNRMIP